MSIIVQGTDSSSALCPELATPSTIITKENVDALSLSNYSRIHGTVVKVTCLAYPDYVIQGFSTLTCLNSGQWDRPTPKCVVNSGTDVSGGGSDISMVPMMVVAATAAVILLAMICIMIFVLCCWKQSGLHCQSQRGPIGLFRSLSLREAESVFSERRHRYYAASECSDVIDSISTRCPPPIHTHTPQMAPKNHDAFPIIRAQRGARPPSLVSFDQSDYKSRSSPTTRYTGRSKGTESSLKTCVGTGRSYRTWHELFYDSNS